MKNGSWWPLISSNVCWLLISKLPALVWRLQSTPLNFRSKPSHASWWTWRRSTHSRNFPSILRWSSTIPLRFSSGSWRKMNTSVHTLQRSIPIMTLCLQLDWCPRTLLFAGCTARLLRPSSRNQRLIISKSLSPSSDWSTPTLRSVRNLLFPSSTSISTLNCSKCWSNTPLFCQSLISTGSFSLGAWSRSSLHTAPLNWASTLLLIKLLKDSYVFFASYLIHPQSESLFPLCASFSSKAFSLNPAKTNSKMQNLDVKPMNFYMQFAQSETNKENLPVFKSSSLRVSRQSTKRCPQINPPLQATASPPISTVTTKLDLS